MLPEKDGAGVVDLPDVFERVGRHDLQVLGRELVGERDHLRLAAADDDQRRNPSSDWRMISGAGKALHLPGKLGGRLLRHPLARREQDRARRARRAPPGSSGPPRDSRDWPVSSASDENLARPGDHVDVHRAVEQPLGGGHVDVARADDLVDAAAPIAVP